MLHVCIGGMQSLFCCILVVIFIQTFNFVQKIPRYVLTKALGGHSVKFPLQYIFNFGQYGIFSRYDSFGDIPGHGATFNLDLQVLWTLKSFLVLFGASFTVRYWIRIKVWSGTPMDKSRQLSVTFPDWFASSVLGAIAVVTLSYNFPTGEKQVVCCSDSLFKDVFRYNFQICPSIQVLFSDFLSAGHLDNINWEFFVCTVKYFFGFFASHNRFFLSSYQSVCTTFLQSVSMEDISLFVVNFLKAAVCRFLFAVSISPTRAHPQLEDFQNHGMKDFDSELFYAHSFLFHHFQKVQQPYA